jgi:delta 1-pyrroline-5-carboxylate dehydrogenase
MLATPTTTPAKPTATATSPTALAVVISPWNFPMAITTGMTVASLVAGNCTILKPAENSSVIAAKIAEILYEAGMPKGVFHYLAGQRLHRWALTWCSIPMSI